MRLHHSVNSLTRHLLRPCIPSAKNRNAFQTSLMASYYTIPNRLFSSGPHNNDGSADSLMKVPTNASNESKDGVIVKAENGEAILVPRRAYMGLSEEFQSTLIERAKKGRTAPIVYTNPGAYSQVDRIPEEVIAALPPPSRPLWPIEESELTKRYLRAFSFSLLFIALGLYLYLKVNVKGSARLELERKAPWAAKLLVTLGIIGNYDYLNQDDAIDKDQLFNRILNKYSLIVNKDQSDQFSRETLGGIIGALLLSTGGSIERASAVGTAHLDSTTPTNKAIFSRKEAVDALRSATVDFPNSLLYLSGMEIFGIVPSKVLSDVEELFDRVVAHRKAGSFFTAESLADLCQEVGIYCTADDALEFLKDCSTVLTQTNKEIGPSTPVDVLKSEFVDFFTAAAANSEINDDKLLEYLRVFYLLHLSGIRERAGVQQVAS